MCASSPEPRSSFCAIATPTSSGPQSTLLLATAENWPTTLAVVTAATAKYQVPADKLSICTSVSPGELIDRVWLRAVLLVPYSTTYPARFVSGVPLVFWWVELQLKDIVAAGSGGRGRHGDAERRQGGALRPVRDADQDARVGACAGGGRRAGQGSRGRVELRPGRQVGDRVGQLEPAGPPRWA